MNATKRKINYDFNNAIYNYGDKVRAVPFKNTIDLEKWLTYKYKNLSEKDISLMRNLATELQLILKGNLNFEECNDVCDLIMQYVEQGMFKGR